MPRLTTMLMLRLTPLKPLKLRLTDGRLRRRSQKSFRRSCASFCSFFWLRPCRGKRVWLVGS